MKRTPFHTHNQSCSIPGWLPIFTKKNPPTKNQLIPTRFHCETSFGILCSSFFRIPPLADCLPYILDYRSFLPLGLARLDAADISWAPSLRKNESRHGSPRSLSLLEMHLNAFLKHRTPCLTPCPSCLRQIQKRPCQWWRFPPSACKLDCSDTNNIKVYNPQIPNIVTYLYQVNELEIPCTSMKLLGKTWHP